MLQTQHHLDQLSLAMKLKIQPAHTILSQRSHRAADGWVVTFTRLATGVIGHVHSVFIPDDYPIH